MDESELDAALSRVARLIGELSPLGLGEARPLIEPFIDLQVEFYEELFYLGAQPNREAVSTRYNGLISSYREVMGALGAMADRFALAAQDPQVRGLAAAIASAADSASRLPGDPPPALPPGMEDVFAEVRENPYGRETVEFLRSLGISPKAETLAALLHLLARPPRRSETPRWKVVASRDPRGFRERWLRSAVWGCSKDFRERPCLPTPREPEAEALAAAAECEGEVRGNIEALLAEAGFADLDALLAAANLSPSELEVARRHLGGEQLVTIGGSRGNADSTPRVLWLRARRKLEAVGLSLQFSHPV